jgi:hypothetical protein
MPAAVMGDMLRVDHRIHQKAWFCWCVIGGKPARDGRYVRAWWNRGGLSDCFDGEVSPGGLQRSGRDHLEHYVAKCKTARSAGPQDAVKLQNANMLAAVMMGTAFTTLLLLRASVEEIHCGRWKTAYILLNLS